MTRKAATDQWLLELCQDRVEHVEVLSLVEHAKAILHVSANPAMDRDDWTEYRGIPSTPSLN